MKLVAPIVGGVLLVAAAGAFALGSALREHPGPARDSARAALLGWDARTGPEPAADTAPRDLRARYWWTLAGFERAISAGGGGRSERLQTLARVAADLQRQAGEGSPRERSVALSLLALTRLTSSLLQERAAPQGPPPVARAVAALRAAVVLDPLNDDAKANLEQLLRTPQSQRSQQRQPGTPRHAKKKGGRPPKPPTVSSPVGGAGRGTKSGPVGY